jgi:hypothetical protein
MRKNHILRGRVNVSTLHCIVAVSMVALIVLQCASLDLGQCAASSANLPPMSLTVVGLNGTQVILNANDIANLPAYTAPGGYLTSAGSIRGIGNYTGVSIITFCDWVGGITADNSLAVTAADGYSMVFTYEQINGRNLVTYDPVTGNEVPNTKPLTMVLAYFKDGLPLSTDDGPLRVAILGPEGLITDGHNWIKFVVTIEISPAVKDWTLALNGVLFENMTRGTFESGANSNCHGLNWTDNNGNVWSGIPLWRLVGRVDDSDAHTGQAFNRTLADLGYDVKVIAGDGYTMEFDIKRVKLDDEIILANQLNGAPLPEPFWPLRLVGSDLSSKEMIRNVIEIQLLFTDTNQDGKVNIIDIALVAKAFGSKPGDPNWNQKADIDRNGAISIVDISLVAKDFGRGGS